ncbi:MAG: SCO family protein [Verrucomicrobiota bacterium]
MNRAALLTVAVGVIALTGCKKKEEPFEILQAPVPAAALQRYWQVPDFSLTERTGQTVTAADLRGKVWIADFFYTTCPGPCPMMTSRLSEIHKATGSEKELSLVSISTDPAKDTPEVLKQYAERFGADERWLFLTGQKEAIFQLANKGFKLSVTDEGGTEREPVTHSTKLVLVDRNGMVRGFYDAQAAYEIKQLIGDAERLLKESR